MESDFDVGSSDDPILFSQTMSVESLKVWYDVMKDEMDSMVNNQVWDVVKLPKDVKAISCKWVYKTKKDSNDNIMKYKTRSVAKGFTQK